MKFTIEEKTELLMLFRFFYNLMYEDKIGIDDGYLGIFDYALFKDKSFKDEVKQFNNLRSDVLSSDREIKAYMLARTYLVFKRTNSINN